MGIESLTIAAQAAGFSMVASDDAKIEDLQGVQLEKAAKTETEQRKPAHLRVARWLFQIGQ